LDEVARQARVGKGTIYLHFADKDDLIAETVSNGLAELCAALGEYVPRDAPFQEQLLSACALISGFFRRRRHLFQLLHTEEGRDRRRRKAICEKLGHWRGELWQRLTAVLRKGVEEGHVRHDVPPELLARYLLSMLRTRGRNRDLDQRSEEDSLSSLVDIFCHGVSHRPVPEPPGDAR
jgi:AcrR family transcriptional regulator